MLKQGSYAFRRSGPARIFRVAHHAEHPVLGEWACRPPAGPVVHEPASGGCVMNVVCIAQGNEQIHVEQIHSASSSSRRRFTTPEVTLTPRRGRQGIPSSSTSKPAGAGLAGSCSSRSRACVISALSVVPRRAAMVFAARMSPSGNSIVVFIWLKIWLYGSRSNPSGSNYEQPLTAERLFAWHASLFPASRSGMNKIVVGRWRRGPIQITDAPPWRLHRKADHTSLAGKSGFYAVCKAGWMLSGHVPHQCLVASATRN